MTDVSEYPIGTVITVYGEWDVDDIPTDPSTVRLYVQQPNGTEDVYTFPEPPITATGAGRYEADLQPNMGGMWHYRWEGVGLADGAREGSFFIASTFVGTDEYTYDPATPVGEVRLLIDDKDLRNTTAMNPRKRSVIFNDAEIGVFISKGGSTLGAASLALRTIAVNRALLVQRREIGKTTVDYGPLRQDLLKAADAYWEQAVLIGVDVMAPADGIVEQNWNHFTERNIIYNSQVRDS